jgi:hypothetical protein
MLIERQPSDMGDLPKVTQDLLSGGGRGTVGGDAYGENHLGGQAVPLLEPAHTLNPWIAMLKDLGRLGADQIQRLNRADRAGIDQPDEGQSQAEHVIAEDGIALIKSTIAWRRFIGCRLPGIFLLSSDSLAPKISPNIRAAPLFLWNDVHQGRVFLCADFPMARRLPDESSSDSARCLRQAVEIVRRTSRHSGFARLAGR